MVHFDAQNTGYTPEVTGPQSAVSEQWSQITAYGANVDVSCPILANNRVYTGMSTDRAVLSAFSAADGTEAWQFQSGVSSSTPAASDGRLYFGDDGVIYAIDSEDGTTEWSVDTDGSLMTSVTVRDGTVYTWGGPRSRRLYAIDAETGAIEWTHTTADLDGPTNDVPPAVHADGVVVAVDVYSESSSASQIRGLAPDGEEQWRYENPTGQSSISAPVVQDGRVFASVGGQGIVALDRMTGEAEWVYPVDTFRAVNGIMSGPAIAEGVVYGTSGGRELVAISQTDGTIEWQIDLGLPTISSPVITGRQLYIGTTDRTVGSDRESEVFGIDTDDGTVDWRWTAPNPVTTTASIGDSTLFVATDRTLHALA